MTRGRWSLKAFEGGDRRKGEVMAGNLRGVTWEMKSSVGGCRQQACRQVGRQVGGGRLKFWKALGLCFLFSR